MPVQPVKIPQNVYIEDRIVGPLTLRQIIMVAIGGGFSYALWASLSKAYGVLSLPVNVMVWTPCVLSILFGFVRINDISMARLVLLTLERINKPTRRTWAPRRGLTINIRTFTTPQTQQGDRSRTFAERDQSRLEEISSVLDRGNDDVPEETVAQPEHVVQHHATPSRPVDRNRIVAEPLETPADATPSISLFRDIQPR
jgi:PrgI family protein